MTRPGSRTSARADSITIDPHKWFFQAYDIGGLLVRRRDDLLQTFHRAPEYYRHGHPGEEPIHWHQYSFEGTRRFRALKLWASWKHLGTAGLGRLVEMNNDLAAHLAARIAASDDLEPIPAGDPDLSVVCFRHVPGGRARAAAARSVRRRPCWTATRTCSAPPSSAPARAGSRPRSCAAGRACGPGS